MSVCVTSLSSHTSRERPEGAAAAAAHGQSVGSGAAVNGGH